ncbi:hypothetical protein FOXB_16386 [Fusarium oxysporum f. sp. conglutinans Fo5176]|uniref:Uncharacterized protein n=1 Tax=Fusarium oxysporum (strain Fo5176) TaxID=660025 RepID=F9GCK3_FUSOF|nr:hypothetical protein FOXB_16386 [Fusarium oxysporum f. sp. conglutinans Fo5176]
MYHFNNNLPVVSLFCTMMFTLRRTFHLLLKASSSR